MQADNVIFSDFAEYNENVTCSQIANPIVKLYYTNHQGDRVYNTTCPARSACAHSMRGVIQIDEENNCFLCPRINIWLPAIALQAIKTGVVGCSKFRAGNEPDIDDLIRMANISRDKEV